MKDEYLSKFFTSLYLQTYKEFDLIIVNDGYTDAHTLQKKFQDINIIYVEGVNQNIPKNRELGINYCINKNYDILIFGDSDDYFAKNRIEVSIKLLETNNIVVNDLSLFDTKGIYENKYISNRLENNSIINFEFIKNKNIFGLSNTAINLNILTSVSFDDNLIAVDWELYKGILSSGESAIFTNKTLTYYRQYQENTIGLHNDNNEYPLWWENNNTKG